MVGQTFFARVQRRLLEESRGGALFGSGTWTVAEAEDAALGAQQAFLGSTHLQIGYVEIPVTAGSATVTLPDDWIATALPAWRDSTGRSRSLPLGDRLEADLALGASQQTNGRPQLFVDASTDSLAGRLIPTPDEDGTLLLYYVPAGTAPTADAEEGALPDFLAVTYLQWATVAVLLSKVGRGFDPTRAAVANGKAQLAQAAVELLLGGYA